MYVVVKNLPGALMISPFWLIEFEMANYYTNSWRPLYKFQRRFTTSDAEFGMSTKNLARNYYAAEKFND